MKDSIHRKLQHLVERYEEIAGLLSTEEVINNQDKFRELSKEYAQIEPVVQCYNQLIQAQETIDATTEMLSDDDDDMKALAEDEIKTAKETMLKLDAQLQILLLPKDPNDDANIYLEIRAGTGGDEASIFAGNLFRMYSRYCEQKGWKVEIMSVSEGEHGGYKEIISKVNGFGAYSQFKFESGAHRVQRVPVTESQGRVHTSACTVAIMPEVAEVEEIVIDAKDLRIDTYRAQGAGGQHVNKTDSAVRLTHLPTGTVVECQDERSQHKNKARAMSLLKARILASEQEKQAKEQASTRKSLVGSGDRSERIRTYNYPQGRITDHRINLTLYKLDEVMQGDLDPIIEPLIREHQADLLAEIGD